VAEESFFSDEEEKMPTFINELVRPIKKYDVLLILSQGTRMEP
jgi:hypothetical protein